MATYKEPYIDPASLFEKKQPKQLGSLTKFLLRYPVLASHLAIASLVSFGIVISLIFNTSTHTSSFVETAIHRDFYFAKKSNIFNQYFVKLGWLWTCIFFSLHILSTPLHPPPTSGNRNLRRVLKFLIATTIWFTFQSWFNARVFYYSGGACALRLPDGVGGGNGNGIDVLDLPQMGERKVHTFGSGSSETRWLEIPNSFCYQRKPVTESEHPELAQLFMSLVDSTGGEEKAVIPIPKLGGGFDISGHVFLMTLSTALIFDDLAPTVIMLLSEGWDGMMGNQRLRYVGIHWRALNLGSKALGAWLVILWLWMMLMTSIFFHSPQEKLSGFFTGVFGAYAAKLLPDLLIPLINSLLSSLP